MGQKPIEGSNPSLSANSFSSRESEDQFSGICASCPQIDPQRVSRKGSVAQLIIRPARPTSAPLAKGGIAVWRSGCATSSPATRGYPRGARGRPTESGERPALRTSDAAAIRASDAWRGIHVTDLLRLQLERLVHADRIDLEAETTRKRLLTLTPTVPEA